MHVSRKNNNEMVADEVRQCVIALEESIAKLKATSRPGVWCYVMLAFVEYLKERKEWPKEL